MKLQAEWILWIFSTLWLVGIVTPSTPSTLSRGEKIPDKSETEVCGSIRDVIQRDSGRFRRILIRNTNSDVRYINEHARRMTSRTKSKLDVLASLVINEWNGRVRVRVTRAWTDQVDSSDPASLHYEGRSVRLETSDGSRSKLGRLAGLAIEAGFDWVEYSDANYIRASVIPDVCQTSVDLVFLLDGSGSVGSDNFRKVKDFVKRVIDFFNIGVDGTRVSVVTYETDTHIEFNLVRYFTKNALRNAVDDIEYRGYLTYTGEALNTVREKIFTEGAGMRDDDGIPKVLVLLTDGYSNGIKVLEPANKLRNLGVSIFSIGVGPSVSRTELRAIASDPNEDYVFTLSSFNQLADFVDRVSSVSCSEGSLINACKAAETTVESGSFKYFRTTFDVVTKDQVSVEIRDLQGISHLYASASSRNPGPLDADSIKNEEDTSPKAVPVKLDDTKTVYVAVQGQMDVNKFRLSFWDNLFEDSGSFQVDVREGLSANREVITLSMVQNNYRLRYSISDGNETAFEVETQTPKVSTKIVLDYETHQQYTLVVVADDLDNACHRSRAQLKINVIDVNDNRPKFSKSQYTATVAENAQVDALVETVVATDLDSGANGQISYSIESSSAPGLFEIHSNGDVTLKGSLDFEKQDSYDLTIKAKDHGVPSMEATVVLTVHVTDVNEQPKIDCVSTCIHTVSEDVRKGTVVGRVSALDPDVRANCLLQYSIPREVAKKFSVTGGNITTVAGLNREDNSQYVFFVTVRDCGSPPLTDSIRITITISDVNDNSPQFPAPYDVDILESESSGSRVVQVKATDADEGANAEIKYSITGPDASSFSIDEDDGTIKTATALDYETTKSYSFTVVAQDQGPGARTGNASVTVNVKDVNDNAPSFEGTPYVANVKENAKQGTRVIDVNATDSDSGLGGEVKYSIIAGNVGLGFSINEDSGLITVRQKTIDQETTPSYTLTVQATDKGSPSMHTQIPVSITVVDTNDNPPVFQGLPYSASVPEDFDTIKPVLKVSATDEDAGAFGDITYSIDSSDIAKDTFKIDSNGNIRLKTTLDYETTKDYDFSVVATDGGGVASSATVKIFVTDVNDHEPRFGSNPYEETVAENMSVDHVVGTVKATDEDSGQRGSVTYSIIDGNIGDAFTINADGKVRTLTRLDRETRPSYNLTIQAEDSGSPAKSSTTRMEITVTDENDNAPTFDKTFYSFMIHENNIVDAVVGEFGPATDKDEGANREIVYTIKSGDPDGVFEYDPSGKLKAKKVLDRENTPLYDLVIEAEDKGSPPMSVEVPVQVIVVDKNDNGPVFVGRPYKCDIDENSAKNSRVCTVLATDEDAGQNGVVIYELDKPSTTFSIGQDNGEIKALVTLDREERDTYTFNITARDTGSPGKNSTITIVVKVLDKNDNEPKFNRSSYSFDVSENANLNAEVGQVFAEDADEGLNGQVIHRITGGNTGDAFSISHDSGRITVQSSLDRETIASYKLTVEAADRGTPSQFSRREVVITVTDVNDNDPIFTGDPYNGTIAEDASVGSPVVQVKATDLDEGVNGQIKYSITGGVGKDNFTIDEVSGFISTATQLDYESKKSYVLTVTASDGGASARTDTAQVDIAVENTNDNAPTFEPSSPIVRVSEAVAIGTNVVKFNATDKDGNTLTFSITSGNTGETFVIDENTGVLTTNASLDRETVPTYNLTVTVTDKANGSAQSTSKDLQIIVTDENDNAPRFEPEAYSVNVTENTSSGPVVTVTATDDDEGDNAKITFSIDSTSAQKFLIDSTSGKISSKAPLDYEERPRYVITVTAKDAGSPELSSTATVVVTILDLNDNNPAFQDDYSTSLRENTADGSVIRVEATDPDSGVNGEIEYNITAGDDDGFFTIGDSDGIIKVAKPTDRERNPLFTLTITARNKVPSARSAAPTKSSATVTITIEDVNDNAPIINNTITSVEIQENSPNGSVVVDVDAIDHDVGANGEIEFAIVDGNVDEAFVINTTTGVVTVKGAIDRETRESYTLKVRASDKGSPPLFSEKEFMVNVTDVNDNSPVFIAAPYEASVSEAANVSTFVIQIKASDADAGPNGNIRFSIVSGNDQKHFKIDSGSGNIITNAPLDYETTPTYTLVVRVEDTTHSIETNVKIRLVNINDNAPIFNPASYTESITEGTKQGKDILTLNATDKDEFGGLTYTIVSGNLNSRFTLEPGSGKLRVAGDLDREAIDLFNLTVRVTDGGAPARYDTAFVVIRITDVNDNAPKFNTSREEVTVRENSPVGTPVLTVFAEDLDVGLNGDVRYTITGGNEKGLLKLHESSGVLSVDGNIDRESLTNFRLVIVARDQGNPPLQSSTLTVDIEVLDENDNSPQFTKGSYARNISETSSIGSFVEEVQAIDADVGLNAKVVYSLVSGSQFVKIHNETGVISTRMLLDRENVSTFTAVIQAKDLGTPSQNSTTTLTVTVQDANDNAPQFDPTTLRASVTEERPPGQFVIRVVATDADVGANAKIEYKLESNAKHFLEIDSETGDVKTRKRFDFEVQRNRTFKVIASDKGNPPLSTTATLYIEVLDTDDNCPEFNPKEYNLTIQENRPLDMTIVTVYATDVDTVGEKSIEYGIREGNLGDTFRILRYTGEIKSLSFIDRELADLNGEFNLVVRAGKEFCGVNDTKALDETSRQILSNSIAKVNIIITDLNDNAPVFTGTPYKHKVTDIYASALLRLSATDSDEGINAEFEFGLAGVTRDGSTRTLTVTATDKGTPQLTSNTTVEVIGEKCEAMKFDVSFDGNVTVKTLCSFKQTSVNGKDLVGQDVTFNCVAEGNTVPEYRWTKNGVPVTQWKNTSLYVITSLRKDNAGVYSCIALSEAGNIVSRPIRLNARESAKIVIPPKETWAQIGNAAKLSCLATGDKPISYSWYKNGVLQLSNSELDFNKPDINFNKILAADEGKYACSAENAYGKETSEPAMLHVFSETAIVEMEISVDNPRLTENCQLFNMTSVTNTLNGLIDGRVAVVEFEQPASMCNITACSSDPCQNGGTCIVKETGFNCQCPRGWGGVRCQIDANECQACQGDVCSTSNETCRNNGTCVNRIGSFSCTCPGLVKGKLCQFNENKVCKPNPCKAGETCYAKETTQGYECLARVQTIKMEYKLEANRLPFESWMIYDIAQGIENAILTRGENQVSQRGQGGRRRRATTPIDYRACSVRVQGPEGDVRPGLKETTLDLVVILVCANAPTKKFVCNALMAEGKVKSCTAEGDNVITEPETTTPPRLEPLTITVVFIARDKNNEDISALKTITVLKGKNINEKLDKSGMIVVDLRARITPTTAKQESDGLHSGAIAGIILAVVLVILVAVLILFVFLRSRRNKNRDLSMGSRAILPNNSTKQKRHMNRDISMKEIKDAEVRGINNKMFSEVAEKRRDSADVEDGSFMVQIPKSISKTNIVDQDYMNEFESATWFHGPISRSKAEDILANQETEGSFLVRAGVDQGEFYVSTTTSEVDTKCRHIAVNRHDDCFVAVCGPESEAKKFTTFHELVDYLRSTPTRFEDNDSELLLKDFVEKNST